MASNKVKIEFDVKGQRAVSEIGKISKASDQAKKKFAEQERQKQRQQAMQQDAYASGIDEAFSSFGFGGVGQSTSALMQGQIGAAALGGGLVLGIQGLTRAWEYGMERWEEYLQQLIEINKSQEERQKQIAQAGKGKGFAQGALAEDIEQIYSLEPDVAAKYISQAQKVKGERLSEFELRNLGRAGKQFGTTLGEEYGNIYGAMLQAGESPISGYRSAAAAERLSGGRLDEQAIRKAKKLAKIYGISVEDAILLVAEQQGLGVESKNIRMQIQQKIESVGDVSSYVSGLVESGTQLTSSEIASVIKGDTESQQRLADYRTPARIVAKSLFDRGKMDEGQYATQQEEIMQSLGMHEALKYVVENQFLDFQNVYSSAHDYLPDASLLAEQYGEKHLTEKIVAGLGIGHTMTARQQKMAVEEMGRSPYARKAVRELEGGSLDQTEFTRLLMALVDSVKGSNEDLKSVLQDLNISIQQQQGVKAAKAGE